MEVNNGQYTRHGPYAEHMGVVLGGAGAAYELLLKKARKVYMGPFLDPSGSKLKIEPLQSI